MKKSNMIKLFAILIAFVSVNLFMSCSNDNEAQDAEINTQLSQADKDALLFMLEEEKMARDTYEYLNDFWGMVQFANIELSEQSHMNAVANLLEINNIQYNILPEGEFENINLQNLYNQFVIDGQLNSVKALQIGALIEDLDIVDLENNLNATKNTSIIEVFESLQCGSRNHLRTFVSAIENLGGSYTPQFLAQNEYNLIINNSHEKCN